jgi:F0F1-type ATP synthase assembly protein I
MNDEPSNDRERRPPEHRRPVRIQPGFGLVFDLGLRLVVSILLGLGLGLLLSDWFGSSLYVLLGLTLGVAAAMYTIWDVARETLRK